MVRRPRIPVIEDDPVFRSLIVSLLRQDYLVGVAAEGFDGYTKALNHPPDLAIVEMQMPGWDGLRTLASFRSHPTLKSVPVVMLSGDAGKQTVLAAIGAGASDFVLKPKFCKDEFVKKLERLLSQKPIPAPSGAEANPSLAAASPVKPAAAGPARGGNEVSSGAAGMSAAAERPRAGGMATLLEEVPDDDPRLQELIDHWE